MEQIVEFKKAREFGEIIGDTFLFIKQNFKPLMKAYFYLCGFFILGGLLITVFTQLRIVGMVNPIRANEINNPIAMLLNFSFSYFLIIVLKVLSYTSFYVTILSYIALYIEKGNIAPSVPEVWSYFRFYFFRMLGGGFLITCFAFLCFICCIIPGIWVAPAVTIFYAIMIMENAGISYAFNRSFKLVSEEWWITFATIIVIYLIYFASSMLVQVPALIIVWASAFTHLENPINATYAIVTTVSQHLSEVFLIIPIVCSALIYFNLVERKENTGLMSRIEGMGNYSATDHAKPEEY